MIPADPFPEDAYLDTSLLVAGTIDGLVHSGASRAFCRGLVAAGSHVYFSQIVRLEVTQVLARLPKDVQMPAELRRAYNLDRWDSRLTVRQEWLAFGVQEFQALIDGFAEVTETPFSLPIWRASIDVMARTNLRSHDAIHVATARAVAVRDVATIDDHFRRVPDLNVRLIRDPTP